MLFNEHLRKARASGKPPPSDIRNIAENNATNAFNARVEEFFSTSPKYPLENRLKMLRELTHATRKSLSNIEGDLWIPWAAAQQVNAQHKVEFSINEGFKKYWVDLGKSTVFEENNLLECMSRIHVDILKSWNFNDKEEILSGDKFRAEMIKLIEPLLSERQPGRDDILSHIPDWVPVAGAIIPVFGQVLAAIGVGGVVVKFLYTKYQKIPLTALCFGAYIADLTLILHALFINMLSQEPPRSVSRELALDSLRTYKDSDSTEVHNHIREIVYGSPTSHPEKKIVGLIRKKLGMDTVQKTGN
ncbi:hypothetical protein GYMLUDRAFT_494940 [Collybiopsis luxurians FD-317 M1]|uniref:Unplaced genomic scaffold GYMLUscaffold_186, whole genome shotgun sequence n=1 Tax=Collybiopsis luxurians FD-317 M1 TaxID=944289 RepID=A0A0D0BX45_9AGAR|nr:hypothetical protein GYMLUDRAFT_494940 [Collybiopsis luxurians FD-317 M1]